MKTKTAISAVGLFGTDDGATARPLCRLRGNSSGSLKFIGKKSPAAIIPNVASDATQTNAKHKELKA